MKTWHIWDFPDNVYVSLKDDFREEFFNLMFKKLGGKRPYARFLGLDQMAIKSYHRGFTHKKGIKHPQAIPLWVFKKSINLMGKELKRKLENNIFLLKAKNRGIPLLNPKLPFEESPEFYRIVAHMLGDGSAPERKVPYYANTCKELREQFEKDLGVFGETKIYERKPNTTPIICFPKVITDILSHILEIRFSNPTHLPRQIFQSSEECKSAFLQALFDDEGCSSNGIVIRMKSNKLVNELNMLLSHLGIKTNKIFVAKDDSISTLSINSKCIGNFKEKVGFFHPKKIKNLDAAINTKKRLQRTRNPLLIENLIIENLREIAMGTVEMANKLQFTVGYTLAYLKRLEKEGKVKRSGFRNKLIWSLPKV